ncbi:MAG: Panacea domain-containing protein [Patescibacteria group bacterium]
MNLKDYSPKYINLILYILERANDVNLGKKKLFKLLYFIDFDFYEKNERSITGDKYIVQQYGPVPSLGETILTDMVKGDVIQGVKAKSFGYEQKRFIPNEKADLSVFTGEELEHIDAVVNRFSNSNGSQIEVAAKMDMPYRAAKGSSKKYIDYDATFYRTPSRIVLEDEITTKG